MKSVESVKVRRISIEVNTCFKKHSVFVSKVVGVELVVRVVGVVGVVGVVRVVGVVGVVGVGGGFVGWEGSHAPLVEAQLLLRAAAASTNADKLPFLERNWHIVSTASGALVVVVV